jgi:predicted HTH transcriptional regulator
MTSEELEKIREGNVETQRIDFKAPCPWNIGTFAKHILAMSNVQNGGHIIIGVQEINNTFEWVGVPSEIKDTYSTDRMRDEMTIYADPHVNFSLQNIKVRDKEFVVIEIEQFEEAPVICRTDRNGLIAGTIYYRNRNRRAESAPVSNSADMREIILLATSQQLKKFKGYNIIEKIPSEKDVEKKKLKEELGDL